MAWLAVLPNKPARWLLPALRRADRQNCKSIILCIKMAQAFPTHQIAKNDCVHEHTADLSDWCNNSSAHKREAWQSLRTIMQEAFDSHCHEIHIEPDTDCLRLRYRISGSLQETRLESTHDLANAMITLQQALPQLQSGQLWQRDWFVFPLDSAHYFFQIDLIKTSTGSSYVINRLHNVQRPTPGLDQLVTQSSQLRQLKSLLSSSNGLILIAGNDQRQTTATLRTAAQSLVSPERKIVIAEDSPHPRIARTTQVTVSSVHDTEQLKLFDRVCEVAADVIVAPHINMLSNTLMQLASTKALLIQGAAASSSVTALAQSIAAGVQPRAIARTLLSIIVQHKIACICQRCQVPHTLNDMESQWISAHSPVRENAINDWLEERLKDRFSKGMGCASCNDTGISNLMIFMDVTKPDDDLIDALSDHDIHYAMNRLGQLNTLPRKLTVLASQGVIPLSEAMRLTSMQQTC